MKAVICANLTKPNTKKALKPVVSELEHCGIETFLLTAENYDDKIFLEADFVITVGGDGTMLRWGKKAASVGKPLLGVNTGRLGFMTGLSVDETEKLSRLSEGGYTVSERTMLEVQTDGRTYTALNDAVLTKTDDSRLPEFELFCDGRAVMTVRADGAIIAAPTGSTAYSLSAGGPIISPECECIAFTPICAHSLFSRTVVFGGEQSLSVRFCTFEYGSVQLSVDGNRGVVLSKKSEVRIRKSKTKLSIIDLDGGGFYKAVHHKLIRPIK